MAGRVRRGARRSLRRAGASDHARQLRRARGLSAAVDLSDPASFADGPPHAFLAALRRDAPVWRHPATTRHPGFWVVTRYADVHDALGRPAELSNGRGITIEPSEPVNLAAGAPEQGQQALSYTDPPQHRPLRRLLARFFTPARMREVAELAERTARELVSRFAGAGGGDFVSEVAEPYPLRVLCAVLALPDATAEALVRFVATMDAGPFLAAIHALAEARRRAPGPDLVSAMVHGTGEAGALAAARLGGVLIQLAIAGNETTRAASAQAVRLLAERPEQWAGLAAEPARAPAFVEEVLRFRPPVHYLRRTVARATTLGSGAHAQRVEADAVVYLSLASANRDERVFADPDRFDPARAMPRPHLAFGVGEHFCLGAALARLELRGLLRELARSASRLALAGPPRQAPLALFDALASLPVSVVPRRPAAA